MPVQYKNYTSSAQQLGDAIGNNLPLLGGEFEVMVGTSVPWGNSSMDVSLYKLPKKYMFSAVSVNFPKMGYTFVNAPAGSGFIEASIEPGQEIVVSFWDTKLNHESRVIENYYLNQFTPYGTLRFGYRQSWLTIQVGTMLAKFDGGAFGRPIPTGLSASSTGLMLWQFTFDYENGYVTYDKGVSVGRTIDASFERIV